MKLNLFLITPLIVALTFSSCGTGGKKKKTEDKTVEKKKIHVPAFNADSAYHYIEKQVSFGPRVPNTEAHHKTALWLEEKLSRFTDTVFVQSAQVRAFDGTILNIKNIIGAIKPEANSRILLCAHWDSRPFADFDPNPDNSNKAIPGANDGASGVGVLLEIARQMKDQPPDVGVDIIFFDAEDYGEPEGEQTRQEDSWALGSQHWAKNPHQVNYNARFGILLDMVGAGDATFPMEGTSMYYAPDIMKKVWDLAQSLGYDNYFRRQHTSPLTDDHLYINEYIGIPTIDIIHYDPANKNGFFEYWHTMKDDMSNISKPTLKAVGEVVLHAVYRE
ncbi:MAG: M28 family peptidase [Bacteroidales bacterium]|nr:M28 family peptidase [Bacteroidales bacterium]